MGKNSKKNIQTSNFSQYMHPKNPYTKYDYEGLAKLFLEFKSYLSCSTSSKDSSKQPKYFLDWSNRDAVRCLMKCCLKRDFGLDLEMPEGCLAPSLALKMNYLLWIEDAAKLNQRKRIAGLDIGTGGGIYFCAMAAKKFSWRMVGTEANLPDFEIAQRNIHSNQLSGQVEVFHNDNKHLILPETALKALSHGNEDFRVTMCNPPFYDESFCRRERSKFDPDAGRQHEMVVEGGEIEFIKQMIDESIQFGHQVDIFTTMIGHKKSLGKVLEKLSSVQKVNRWVVNEFCQGKTMRWCLAWTFKDTIQLKASAPISESKHERKIHTPVRFSIKEFNQSEDFELKDVVASVRNFMTNLELDILSVKEEESEYVLDFRALSASWRGQRAKRRQEKRDTLLDGSPKRKKMKREEDMPTMDCQTSEPAIEGRIHLQFCEDKKILHFDVSFERGTMGKSAAVELSQFFKNKLTSNQKNEKCKNVK